MIQIDGISWEIPCEIHRNADIKSSEISGLLLNKEEFVDVIGAYLSFSVKVPVPMRQRGAYNSFYEAITAAVGWHTVVMPYGNDTVSLTAKILNVQDTWFKTPAGNYWEGCSFTVIGVTPTKTQTLSEAISYGLPPWPSTVEVPLNSTWQYTANGWVVYEAPTYTDADDVYY